MPGYVHQLYHTSLARQSFKAVQDVQQFQYLTTRILFHSCCTFTCIKPVFIPPGVMCSWPISPFINQPHSALASHSLCIQIHFHSRRLTCVWLNSPLITSTHLYSCCTFTLYTNPISFAQVDVRVIEFSSHHVTPLPFLLRIHFAYKSNLVHAYWRVCDRILLSSLQPSSILAAHSLCIQIHSNFRRVTCVWLISPPSPPCTGPYTAQAKW